MEKILYHYTALIRWEQIKQSGYLKLTPSNLLKPKNPHMVKQGDGTYVYMDETDSYKPVVWLTDSDSPKRNSLGVAKEVIQISIPMNKDKHQWWMTWQKNNKMDKGWFKRLTSHGENYGSWYICEETIPMNEFLCVKNMITGEILYQKDVAND